MLSKLTTKIALRKAGLNNLSLPSLPSTNSKSGDSNASVLPPLPEISNPFANVNLTIPKAFQSWQSAPPPPSAKLRAQPVKVGEKAPWNVKLKVPGVDGRPVVVVFLRYCGCPFAEKIFLTLRSLSLSHPSIHFIALSHCTPASTNRWVSSLGGAGNVDIVIDASRELYALWGLGMSSYAHLLNPRCGFNQIMLGRKEGVWGREIGEGACRWQVGGAWAVDGQGVVRWGGGMQSVDEAVDLDEGVRILLGGTRPGVF